MPMTKLRAQAAVKVLRGGSVGDLFQRVKSNQHTLEKHFSKVTARQAAVNDPQGYFKKKREIKIEQMSDLKGLSNFKKAIVKEIIGVKKGNPSQKDIDAYNQNNNAVIVEKTSAASTDDILNIINSVLSNRAHTLRQASQQHINDRFIVVAPMPNGYAGRAIDGAGEKYYDIDNAVVVINAADGVNPQFVTVFPADDDYVSRFALLT